MKYVRINNPSPTGTPRRGMDRWGNLKEHSKYKVVREDSSCYVVLNDFGDEQRVTKSHCKEVPGRNLPDWF